MDTNYLAIIEMDVNYVTLLDTRYIHLIIIKITTSTIGKIKKS